jgi:sporulation protein YlmC with PRC-barrel domain
MELALNAKIYTSDSDDSVGHLSCIVVNPVSDEVTHFVIRVSDMLHNEYLLHLEDVAESSPDKIRLTITRQELANCHPFLRHEYLADQASDLNLDTAVLETGWMTWPYAAPMTGYEFGKTVEEIPHSELGIHIGSKVEASDGHIGTVNEFLVNPENHHITHIILREGHLWGRKDVCIPLSEIEKIEDDRVLLKLDKHAVRNLPDIALRGKEKKS